MQVKIKKLTPTAKTPTYGTDGAAAFDIYADLEHEWVGAHPGKHVVIPTGLSFEVPAGHVLRVYSRSGHGFTDQVTLVNSVGVIDSDYRGEMKVPLVNLGRAPFTVEHGMRIAQMVVAPVARATVCVVEELDGTSRGAGGFGSTGR